jgi:hypothetical protein
VRSNFSHLNFWNIDVVVDFVEVGGAFMCLIPRVTVGGMRRGSLFLKQATAGHIFVLLSTFGLFVCLHAFGVSLPIEFFCI